MKRVIGFLIGMSALAQAETLTLEQAVAEALAGSPDGRVAEARLEAAQAVLLQAESAFQPRLSLESSYLRTNQPVSVFGTVLNQRAFSPALNFNDVPDVDNWNTRGVLSVPIYAGGRNVANRDAAQAGLAATGHGGEAVRQALGYEVAKTWLMAWQTRSLKKAADAAVVAFEKNLDLVKKRQDAGSALKADLLDMEVRLAQAKEDRVHVENANALARHALRNLLGREQGEIQISSQAPRLAVPAGDAAAERPELRAALERERAVEAQIRAAKAGWKPQVQAFGSVEHNRGGVLDGHGSNYTAGVMLKWNLWDGRQTRGMVDEAAAQLRAAQEETRKLRLGIDLEVTQARLSLKEAQERLQVSERVIEQAEESVELTRDRFDQGLSLSTQLIDAETALTAARVRRAQAETDRLLAVAALRRALGLQQVGE
ncbi:MAG: TolC family protein [Verrucomicrobiales bacterium]|nr:TolC family protein [Verrucomicrobiales bacterium]